MMEENKTYLANNKYYYLIIQTLLEDDKNYLFIKDLIKENKHFVNARFHDQPIIFLILDRYIYNLKKELVNQKLVHNNPHYFYSLLKLYLQEDLDLTNEEVKQFHSRLEELKSYLTFKQYRKAPLLIDQINDLFTESKTLPNYEVSSYQLELKQMIHDVSLDSSRVKLMPEYLIDVASKVETFKSNYYRQYNCFPDDNTIALNLNLPLYDIRNSRYISDTWALEGKKYAFSKSYDADYNQYLRIHVIDTTFIDEDSPWYQEMKYNMQTNTHANKLLKFKENQYYPTMTYQFKIAPNGLVSSFKTYASAIKIDQKIRNKELMDYRADYELKNLVAALKSLSDFYNYDLELLSTDKIEEFIDYILNIELKNYFKVHNLPTLYYVDLELNDEEKTDLHTAICYYLGKIPKQEAHEICRILDNAKRSRFYHYVDIEESKIELDPTNFIGYQNLVTLKSSLKNMSAEAIRYKYQDRLLEGEQILNNDEVFKDYFTSKKLIRAQKVGEDL